MKRNKTIFELVVTCVVGFTMVACGGGGGGGGGGESSHNPSEENENKDFYAPTELTAGMTFVRQFSSGGSPVTFSITSANMCVLESTGDSCQYVYNRTGLKTADLQITHSDSAVNNHQLIFTAADGGTFDYSDPLGNSLSGTFRMTGRTDIDQNETSGGDDTGSGSGVAPAALEEGHVFRIKLGSLNGEELRRIVSIVAADKGKMGDVNVACEYEKTGNTTAVVKFTAGSNQYAYNLEFSTETTGRATIVADPSFPVGSVVEFSLNKTAVDDSEQGFQDAEVENSIDDEDRFEVGYAPEKLTGGVLTIANSPLIDNEQFSFLTDTTGAHCGEFKTTYKYVRLDPKNAQLDVTFTYNGYTFQHKLVLMFTSNNQATILGTCTLQGVGTKVYEGVRGKFSPTGASAGNSANQLTTDYAPADLNDVSIVLEPTGTSSGRTFYLGTGGASCFDNTLSGSPGISLDGGSLRYKKEGFNLFSADLVGMRYYATLPGIVGVSSAQKVLIQSRSVYMVVRFLSEDTVYIDFVEACSGNASDYHYSGEYKIKLIKKGSSR